MDKQKKVLCYVCDLPIKIEDYGGESQQGSFHRLCHVLASQAIEDKPNTKECWGYVCEHCKPLPTQEVVNKPDEVVHKLSSKKETVVKESLITPPIQEECSICKTVHSKKHIDVEEFVKNAEKIAQEEWEVELDSIMLEYGYEGAIKPVKDFIRSREQKIREEVFQEILEALPETKDIVTKLMKKGMSELHKEGKEQSE